MTTKMYTVEGMHCNGCVASVRTALKDVAGVIEARVQLNTPQAIVSMQEALADQTLAAAVAARGAYRLSPYDDPQAPPPPGSPRHGRKFWNFFLPKKQCCR